ncbi:type II secretion system ATPase GspE [Pseudomonas aeruginosa]|uniref:type II secretion system ATPase GspE n=1 Tax=Pseudomonas aeruginosa TaxID=287 RepID=UPI000EB4A6C6|nr:type II secretion system ATPase GspE [Pseudomonas aeruginosa]EIU1679385.1 type II secretion system ATPase GspE [Pseudomonas aeruginosa]TEC57068.1 type II secretion system protein GspE [Pseudomonas aeruginosa]WCX96466.1 type II secretion system ATPase GspE [Pseudomonas aeruginosa]HCU2030113.1 type II secretion system ATPase GspE [Pseudomonas aeruginosa]HEK0150501.1 type II secretion system ATPase GspE [Pseudomonas aeruginosa]
MSAGARLPFSYARRHGVLLDDDQLYCRADSALAILAEVRRHVGAARCRVLGAEDFAQRLAAHYRDGRDDAMQMAEGLGEQIAEQDDLASLAEQLPQTTDLLDQEDDAPIIRLINAILGEAVKAKASDIHLETFEQHLSVRLRVDGLLREILRPRRELAGLLVSRIKVMAKLDIAEKRIPQDGRIALRIAGHEVDVRVSTLPSAHGERVVMRLLDKQAGRLDLGRLGMAESTRERLEGALRRPHGILLVTGPTGSGKTTTLYAGLASLNSLARNILTIEDPVEYHLPGIGQTQVNAKVDMTFARGLRAILRQDPDVVMVGEIRDRETAEIAVQASLTGHLVLSTLHTNSAVGAVTRLVDMGVEPFLLCTSLLGVLAQRLVRVLCPQCKRPAPADGGACERLDLDPLAAPTLFHPQGCPACQHSGYRGRQGIYELVLFDEGLRQRVHEGAGEAELARYARQHGHSLFADGREKVLLGVTSLEELLRVTQED